MSPRRLLSLLLHASFLLVAVAAVGRLIAVDSPLCPVVITLTSLLGVGYALGLAQWDRIGRWRPAWLGALVLLWLALMLVVPVPYSAAFGWLAVPLALLAMRAMPFGAGVGVTAGISVALVVHLVVQNGFQVDLVVAPIAAVWATVALYAAQQHEVAQRQRLIGELTAARDELVVRQRQAGVLAERARIAGDIHDTLAQELAGSRMLLQAAERDWAASPDSARENVRAATDALGENLEQTRRMIADLTPVELDHSDLALAVEGVCERERRYGRLVVDFHVSGEPRPIDEQCAVALVRTAQGALANVRDHAEATSAEVLLTWRVDQVTLTVSDDGVGFDAANPTSAPGRGYGLTAMRQRLALCLATLDVRSAPGAGTTLTAGAPVLADTGVLATIT